MSEFIGLPPVSGVARRRLHIALPPAQAFYSRNRPKWVRCGTYPVKPVKPVEAVEAVVTAIDRSVLDLVV
jgi:hypothetical protein